MSTARLAHALLDIGALADGSIGDGSLETALRRFVDATGSPAESKLLEVEPEPLLTALVVVLTLLTGTLADALDLDVADAVERLRTLVDDRLRTA
jgi:hypothetical protein